tara:strand:+ start:222 stop:500 length:279 start_codon:yes stop_codon:yes gene_type:complete
VPGREQRKMIELASNINPRYQHLSLKIDAQIRKMIRDTPKTRIPIDVLIRIHFLSHLYGAIAKMGKKEDPVYSTRVCLGGSFETIISMPWHK